MADKGGFLSGSFARAGIAGFGKVAMDRYLEILPASDSLIFLFCVTIFQAKDCFPAI